MSREPYPPEFDGPDFCLVCGIDPNICECPECPVCTEVGDPDCYVRGGQSAGGHMEKGNRAFNVQELAEHLHCERIDQIEKTLFKHTRCGISFWTDGYEVSVAGYAEGSGDAYCEPIVMGFPLDLDAFDFAVSRADNEGCELFEEFHCSLCGGEIGYEEPCEECDK